MHPCIYCLITKAEMEIPKDKRNPSNVRRIGTLIAYNEKFETSGGNIKKAKEYYNSIRKPIFNVWTNKVI